MLRVKCQGSAFRCIGRTSGTQSYSIKLGAGNRHAEYGGGQSIIANRNRGPMWRVPGRQKGDRERRVLGHSDVRS